MSESHSGAGAAARDGRTRMKLRKCRLRVESGPGAGRELVTSKQRIRIGNALVPAGRADSGNDLPLDDRKVARHQCEIALTESGWLLTDLGSPGGTFVEGKRVDRVRLTAGARIRVGDSELLFTPLEQEIVVEADRDGFFAGMVGRSLRMREIFGLLKKIAPTDAGILIGGETGTGKELVARAIHKESGRHGEFVIIDCGSIPRNLIESELFGHEKGAFTGAVSSREGAFERAHGGTIFLDEIGELPLDMQPRLLRVLENREVRRVGGNHVIDVDCRIVAATNRDLAIEVQQGRFREDLFFRLSVINVVLPPLRERSEDILRIVRHQLAQPELVKRHGEKRLSAQAAAALQSHRWPGNVRELMNVVSHLVTFSDGPEIQLAHLPPRLAGLGGKQPAQFNAQLGFHEAKEQLLDAFERDYLTALLQRCEGNISRAARESGLHRKSIERLLKKHEIVAHELG